jgi:pimeloyl-ACP methyl ester carboxylesterase
MIANRVGGARPLAPGARRELARSGALGRTARHHARAMEHLALPAGHIVEHRYVQAGDVLLHVAESGTGPPLVLLHGWPQHWWCWRELIPRLSETYRVLAVDLRGWGWSDAPPGDYAKATFAADILALLDADGLEQVQIIAHDWGAYAGLLLALDYPERVRRMVALDIAPPWRGRPRLRQLGLPLLLSYQVVLAVPGLGTAALTRTSAFVKALIRGGGPLRNWTDDELDAYAHVLRDRARARASSACYRTFLTRELPETFRRRRRPHDLQVPTLLVMGSRSLIRRVVDPEPSQKLRVERIAGAGHFLPEEAPSRVLDLALGFLEAC